jgi:hypothetical protein
LRRGRSATWFCTSGSAGSPGRCSGLSDKSLSEWLSALFHFLASVGKPLLAGLPLLGLLLAVVGYIVTDHVWRLYVRCACSGASAGAPSEPRRPKS